MKKLADDELVITWNWKCWRGQLKPLQKMALGRHRQSELTKAEFSVYRNNSICSNGNTNRSHKDLNLPCGCGSVRKWPTAKISGTQLKRLEVDGELTSTSILHPSSRVSQPFSACRTCEDSQEFHIRTSSFLLRGCRGNRKQPHERYRG